MSDLISREALLQEFNQTAIEFLKDGTFQLQFAAGVICEAMGMITKAPAVDSVEIVHGWWDEERFAFCNVCSNCGLVIDRTSIKMHSGKFNYCPNCGAKMDEVSE